MNIIQKAVTRLNKMVFGSGSTWSLSTSPRSSVNYERLMGDGIGSSVLMAPALWISRRMCESPIVMQYKEDEATELHDMLALLKKPNPYYSGRVMRKAIAVSVTLDGNAYLIKIRNSQLKPVELWYVPHWMIEPHYSEDSAVFIDYYKYTPKGVSIELNPADVWHLRDGLDPRNTRKGLSPLKSLFREVVTDDEAANYTAVMLKNSGVPSVVISPNDDGVDIQDEDAKSIKREFREKFTGDARGGAMVLTRRAKVDTFGWSPKELDLGSLRDIPEERVSAVLGLPAAVVGFGTGLQQTKVGATMQEMRQMAYDDCIIPMQQLHSDEWKNQLLVDFEENLDDWRVYYDNSQVRALQEDEGRIADRAVRSWQGGLITRAEGRKMIKQEVKPEDDVMQMSMGSVLIPRDMKPDVAEEPADEPDEEQPSEQEDPDAEEELQDEQEEKKGSAPTKALPRGYGKLARAMMLDWFRLTELFASELRRNFKDMATVARATALRVFQNRGIEQFMVQPARKITDADVLANMIVAELPAGTLEYGPHFIRVVKRTLKTVQEQIGVGVNLPAGAQTRIVAKGGIRKGLIDLDQQTRDAVFKALAKAREEGMDVNQAADTIADMVEAGPWHSSETRAYVISRTETKYAQNAGSLEAYKEAEGLDGILVFDAQLGDTDQECEDLNGQVVSVEEAEVLATTEHPNGTRSFAPVFSGQEQRG